MPQGLLTQMLIDVHLEVALVARAEHPAKGHWALPGGFARMDESLDRAASRVLPETFTLRRLQAVHETILGRTLNKDPFRRRMLASGLLEATGERESEVGHRPAKLYRFTRRSAI